MEPLNGDVMRKSGWAVAAGLGSLALLLTACGGSSSSSASSPTSAPASSAGPSTAGEPTSAIGGIQPGDVVLMVEKSKLGYVLAEGNQVVVYRYANDKQGGAPTCTGACAATWLALTVQNKPLVELGATLPGKLGTVATADGHKQITYNGYPLYTLKGALPYDVTGDGVEGLWHVIKLSAHDINSQ
jgi:predicted lipoprotein with Yx(FWY)xxD motif